MNITQQGIIALLKSSVTGESCPLPEGFSMEEALPLIKRHHMAPLCYDGAVRCGIPKDTPLMRSLFQAYCKALLISEGQLAQLQRVLAAFEAAGIDHMPLKGSRMKHLYPKPELRSMGDADVLIRMEQYPKIKPIMAQLGFEEKEETDHELVWQTPALYMELHKRLIPSYNLDYHAYFGDGWQLGKVQNGHLFAMTPEDELVYLFTHFAKHYRDGGIGCRHVVDLWVYLRANPSLDGAYIQACLKALRLEEFYGNVRALLAHWFEGGPGSEKLEYMTQFLFASGSWGRMETRVLSRAVRDSSRAHGISGRLVYIWQTLFPPAEVLRGKYTVLRKAPWMLPLVWLWRPVYKVLFERKSLERQKTNLEAFNDGGMEQRRRLLRYVGLDYHF